MRLSSVLEFEPLLSNITMKFFVTFGFLALVTLANAGVSMNNPFFCYMTDPIRSMTNMHSTSTSYEAIRRFNFTTVNPYISSKAFVGSLSVFFLIILFSLYSLPVLVPRTIWRTFSSSSLDGGNDRLCRVIGKSVTIIRQTLY